MSRNSSGTYTLPISGNPVVSGSSVSSTWANSTLADLATEISSSLDRSGRGPMLAPIQVQDGAAGAPSYTFQNEPTSGIYRNAAGDIRMSIGGVDAMNWNGTNTAITAVVTNAISLAGNLTMAGSNPASTTGFSNVLTKKNVPKAWVSISTDGAGAVTVLDGFNIASVAITTSTVEVTFGTAFANANYAVALSPSGSQHVVSGTGANKTTALCKFIASQFPAGTLVNPTTTPVNFCVVFYGQQ